MFNAADWFAYSLGLSTGLGVAAVIWFYKPQIQALVIGANKVSAKLHAQADALIAKTSAAVDAAKKA
jgi:hypothetical protein